mgnify:FL=1
MDKINADQVVWVRDALTRLSDTRTQANTFPRVSRLQEAAIVACILEIMEVLGLEFEDDAARANATAALMFPTNTIRNVSNAIRGASQ